MPTTNLGMTLPLTGADSDSWGDLLNANQEIIDGVFAAPGNGTSVGLNVGSGKTLTLASGSTLGCFGSNVTGKTGTGSLVLSASPTFTGTATFAAIDLGATGQIKFPATQNASANANTLDDYEEGTWTATEAYAAFTWTFAAQRYTKIGNLVRAQCSFTTAASQASAVQMRLGGLPFNAAQTTGASWGYSTSGENGSFYLAGGTAYLDLFTAAGAIAQYQNFQSKTFSLNFTYEAS